MLPHLHLLGFEIRTYIICLALAALVCHTIGPRWAQSVSGIRPRTTRLILLWLGLAAFAGGRAHFAINSWPIASFSRNPVELLRFWEGLHAGGALIALAVATPLVCRAHGVAVARFADAVAPSALVGVAIARLGCLAAGCCFGTTSSLPWAVSYPQNSPAFSLHLRQGWISEAASSSISVHPLPAYLALAAALGALASIAVRRRSDFDGRAALVASLVFLCCATAAELLRARTLGHTYYWGELSQFFWLYALLAATAAAALLVGEVIHRVRALQVSIDPSPTLPS